jgi:NAD(P)-dependent dehydrogenase (short-subunit alcohol dehydrogenase family)
VTDAGSIDAFFAAADAALGPIDVLVSNAGIGVPGLLHEVPIADLERELRTNLFGPMLVTRRALPSMLERRRGDLVFISSMNVPRNLMGTEWFRWCATINPVSYLIEGMRSLVITGWDAARQSFARAPRGRVRLRLGSEILVRVIDSWKAWGFMRHLDMMDGDQVALAVVHAVTAPPGLHVDVIQVNPERSPGR